MNREQRRASEKLPSKLTTVCNYCNTTFVIKSMLSRKFEKEIVNHDSFSGMETYFKCPHCKREYIADVQTPELEKLQRERVLAKTADERVRIMGLIQKLHHAIIESRRAKTGGTHAKNLVTTPQS